MVLAVGRLYRPKVSDRRSTIRSIVDAELLQRDLFAIIGNPVPLFAAPAIEDFLPVA
jgi:hypothetical protein